MVIIRIPASNSHQLNIYQHMSAPSNLCHSKSRLKNHNSPRILLRRIQITRRQRPHQIRRRSRTKKPSPRTPKPIHQRPRRQLQLPPDRRRPHVQREPVLRRVHPRAIDGIPAPVFRQECRGREGPEPVVALEEVRGERRGGGEEEWAEALVAAEVGREEGGGEGRSGAVLGGGGGGGVAGWVLWVGGGVVR